MITRSQFPVRARCRDRPPLVQLGSLESGWALPANGLQPWHRAYVLGTGADATFLSALLRHAPSSIVHVFDRSFTAPVTDGCTAGTDGRRLILHPERVVSASPSTPDAHCLATAMSRRGHDTLDVLAVHETESTADIVGDVLRHELNVRLLCLVLRRPAQAEPLRGLLEEMDLAGYRVVHVAPQAQMWRMTFQARR